VGKGIAESLQYLKFAQSYCIHELMEEDGKESLEYLKENFAKEKASQARIDAYHEAQKEIDIVTEVGNAYE